MTRTLEQLVDIVGSDHIQSADSVDEDYTHDECLTAEARTPGFVVRPASTDQVARVLAFADAHKIPVTPRGAGTGLSGAATPHPEGIVLSFERMNRILEVDEQNFVAVVEPGVTLGELDQETAKKGLVYPIFPGESSASLGGNVATNAGGMRAVKYGVTRNNVLGIEAVLASGEVIQSGGKFVKVSSGYDLTQLIIGSEGTLAVVTKAILKLVPRLLHRSTLLVPFKSLDSISQAVPKLLGTGVGPLLVEYIDKMTMMGITAFANIELGVDEKVQEESEAYLLTVVEGSSEEAVEKDVEILGEACVKEGASDVYVLPSAAATALVDAREKSFWAGKRAGASDIVDVVVPRGMIPEYSRAVREIGQKHATMIAGCGHAGDGNIHLAVFQPDKEKCSLVMQELLETGVKLGGAVSAEHGIGFAKKSYYAKLENPKKLELMRGIKKVFDPNDILNPGAIFD